MRLPLRPATVAVILLSLLVHGLQAGSLGLYWDDSVQLLQPWQAVHQAPTAFVLTDTSGALRSERPFAFLAFALTRLAFLLGVGAVHWLLVGLLTVNALALAAVARRLVDRAWFGFAAAAVFLTYPAAPLQPLWPATVHYLVGCLLILLSILGLDPRSAGSATRSRWMSAGGYAAYLAGVATHEGLALLPPAFFAACWLCTGTRRRELAGRLAGLAATLALLAVWRTLVLPLYGGQLYPLPPERLALGKLLPATAHAAIAAFAPWRSTLHYLRRPSSEAGHWVPAAVFVAAIVGFTCVALLGRAERPANGGFRCALAAAVAMIAAASLALAASPVGIDHSFGLSYGPRGNFIVLPAIAIGLPALLGAVRLPGIATGAALAGLAFAGSLLHFSVKQTFAREWEAHKARLASLAALAPRLADSSVVIIFDKRDRRAPYADHYEMSCYVLALYGNWSLLANTTRHVRFYRDGVESTYHGVPGKWFAAGDRGVLTTARLQPVGRIGYDRVVLFRNDHGRLRAVADTMVTTEDGAEVPLRSNTGRIIRSPPPRTSTWQHIAR